MIGFQITATSPTHPNFHFSRSSWSEGEVWLKHALGAAAPDGADAITNMQNAAIEGIEKGFENLKKVFLDNLGGILVCPILVQVVIDNTKKFSANLLPNEDKGIAELAAGMKKFNLGRLVCLMILTAIKAYLTEELIPNNSHNGQLSIVINL